MGTQPQNNCIGVSHCSLHRPNLSTSLALVIPAPFSFCLPILSVSQALAIPAPFSFCLQNLQVSRAFKLSSPSHTGATFFWLPKLLGFSSSGQTDVIFF
ncbi:unnamed protein product, partial [Prunus brigantina]